MRDSLSIDVSKIKKNSNDFSFISTLFDLGVNPEYIALKANVLNNVSTINEYTNIWQTLSAIGQDVGNEFLTSINNFIDNISNVDLCNTRQLLSLISFFGISYSVFDTIQDFPSEIRQLIDILSIPREYLNNKNKVTKQLLSSIYYNCAFLSSELSDSLSSASNITSARISILENCEDSTISSNWHYSTNNISNGISVDTTNYINDTKLDAYISAVYYDYMCEQLSATYNDAHDQTPATLIYSNLSLDILLSSEFKIKSGNEQQYQKLLVEFNIPKSFDLDSAIYGLLTGLSSKDDFSEFEYAIIQSELSCRAKAYNILYNKTRNKYYRECKFKEYYQFIEKQYVDYAKLFKESKLYAIDHEYFEISSMSDISQLKQNRLLSVDNIYNPTIAVINLSFVERVSHIILDITNAIRDIRQYIKIQCQKNFMKGTFLLLSYVINEYIRNNTISSIKKILTLNLSSKLADVHFDYRKNANEIITYVDPINYFNITTKVDLSTDDLDTSLNTRFWETATSVSAIAAIDNTNIFATPPTVGANNFAFTLKQIEQFYDLTLLTKLDTATISTLNVKPISSYAGRLFDLLSCVFDIGADMTYQDEDENIVTFVDDELLVKYKEDLYKNYIGLSNGATPYYYHTNTVHPSYLIHPYLSNFMEQADYVYPIKNIATIIVNDILYDLCANIDKYIDDSGYIINDWKNPLAPNSDYITRYENSTNINSKNFKDPVIDYEGLFYPYAVILAIYANYVDKMLSALDALSISCDIMTHSKLSTNYYYGLDISKSEILKIEYQISSLSSILREEAIGKVDNTNKNPHCIYKYCVDTYGNMYILVKLCESTASEETKKNANGVLWIRYRNHPIAFPAYIRQTDKDVDNSDEFENNNTLAQLAVYDTTSNRYIKYARLIPVNAGELQKYKTCSILDFYIDNNKQNIIFNIFRDFTYEEDGQVKNATAIVPCICKILKSRLQDLNYNYIYEYEFIALKSESLGNIDVLKQHSELSDYTFDNFYKKDTKIGAIFHKIIDLSCAKVQIPYVDIGKSYDVIGCINANVLLEVPIKKIDNQYNIAVDADQDGIITIAYIADKNISSSQLTNFIEKEFEYTYISNYIRYDQSDYIAVLKYFFGNEDVAVRLLMEDNASKYKSTSFYNTYTDNGFFGVLADNDGNIQHNDLSRSVLTKTSYDANGNAINESELKDRGILKFQLIGKAQDTPIDFKFVLPVKMFDPFYKETRPPKHFNSELSLAGLFDLHYGEDSEPYAKSVSSLVQIYDPLEMQKLLLNNHPTIRIQEEYFKYVNKNNHNRLYDEIVSLPYLWYSKDKYGNPIPMPEKYVNPNAKTIEKQASPDNCSITVYPGTLPISVSWYVTENGIQLDFNTYYYNNFNGNNYFNEKRIFLSLEKPGLSGYLNVYRNSLDLSNDNIEPIDDVIYYIKNISDAYPKFILSASIPVPLSTIHYLATEQGDNVVTEYNNYNIILE